MPTIRVVVRFRPINSREKKTAEENNWSDKLICPIYVDERHLLEFDGDDVKEQDKLGKQVRCVPSTARSIAQQPKFAFDEILVWVNQETAYNLIGHPVVMDALNGINGTIFAYGQTGSGKTFSMFGPEPLTVNNPQLMGIIPRCCAQIFTDLSSNTSIKAYRIDVAFFEIYIHNTIRDLLHPAKKGDPPLKVRDGLKGVFIEHLKPETATNLEEILSLIALANSHRTVSSTKMNATSSRSHSVMRVSIRIERKDGSRCKSQINFGDLAGSEKVNKTGATGQTLREAQAINQSLTMLGNVIAALAKIGSGKKKAGSMVPFRDSALTHVLKDSLSGNCKTTLVVAASPHKFNLLETVSTFRFGSRCKLVKTKAEKNVVLSPGQMRKMIESLKTEIKTLKMQMLKGGGSGHGELSGIGVKITWPNDFQPWTREQNVYKVLTKQINKQIKNVLQISVAKNSDDVENMPYVVSLSDIGTKRKVVIQFHCDDEDEDGDYSREECIALSKKLAHEIGRINKNSLQPALRNYKMCKVFSEASTRELKHVIQTQKTHITVLSEEIDNYQQELGEKSKEIINLQQTMDNFDSVSNVSNVSSGSFASYSSGVSGTGSSIKMPDLFGKSDLRTSSIFNGALIGSNNSLRVSDLLSQLLHSKYQVLRSKRSLQLLQVRYAGEQKKMQQLRYIISRMQAEFMDLKATSLVSKAVLSAAADTYNHDPDPLVATMSISLRDQFSVNSALLDEDDNDFIDGALDDIMNDMDTNKARYRKNSLQTATPQLIRVLSALNNTQPPLNDHSSTPVGTKRRQSRNRAASHSSQYGRDGRSGRERRKSESNTNKPSALGHYNFGVRKNNFNKQIFQDNKQAQRFGKATADYLHKQSSRKELLNDMISSTSTQVQLQGDDGGDDEKKMNDNYVPNVKFTDAEKLWLGYDKEWIKRWTKGDVIIWLKKIYDGRMRKYTKYFRGKKIDGKKLLDLQMPDLLDLHLIRSEAMQILAFTNSIVDGIDEEEDDFGGFFDDLDDFDEFFDDVDVDDFFDDDSMQEDVAGDEDEETALSHRRFYDDPTMRLTDLMIQQLTLEEILVIQQLPSYNSKINNEQTNFCRIKEYYHDYSQAILLVLYGLLCNEIGLLNINEWNDLLRLSRKYKYKKDKTATGVGGGYFDDYMVIINSFVDVYGIYSEYSDYETGKLTLTGSKYFISCIRQCNEMQEVKLLRDDEDAVEFFIGLRIDEMEKTVSRLSNKIWTLINNPLEIEFVYREIRKLCGSKNITPSKLSKCIISEIGAEFVSPDMVLQSIKEMNLSPNPTITLDVWIKKLFIINQESGDGHAAESVLDELIRINHKFELEHYKQQRLEMMSRDSIGSQPDVFDLVPPQTDTMAIQQTQWSGIGSDGLMTSDSDSDYNYNEEKEVSWIDNYLDLHKLLYDVGQFGTCGKCHGFVKLPSNHFIASSVHRKKTSAKRCKLNSKYGWTADYKNKAENVNAVHWIQADLGKITTIFAVAIQGKADADEYITKGVLTVSNKANDEWRKIQLSGDSLNKLSCKDNQTVKVYMFARYIKARYVRLNIYKYHKAPSLRWDLLFGDLKIDIDNLNCL